MHSESAGAGRKNLGLLTPDLSLQVLDVESGDRFFEKKQFFTLSFPEAMRIYLSRVTGARLPALITLAFSLDAHYLVAAHRYATAMALDVAKRTPVSMAVHVRELTSHHFAFVGPDRIVGVNFDHPDKSEVVSFPDGHTISKVTMGRQRITAATHGDYVILRPLQNYAVGVVDLKSNTPILASKEPTPDIYDTVYAHGSSTAAC